MLGWSSSCGFVVESIRVGFGGNAIAVVTRKATVTNELSMLLLILACSLLLGGCAENRRSGDRGEVSVPVSETEAKNDLSASAWATSEDGKLSLRIVTAHEPLSVGVLPAVFRVASPLAFGVWPPANDTTVAGTPVAGNSVGSIGQVQRRTHSPFEGTAVEGIGKSLPTGYWNR